MHLNLQLRQLFLLFRNHIHEDFLTSSRNDQHTDISTNLLDSPTKSTPGVSQSTKDLLCFTRDALEIMRSLKFKQCSPRREGKGRSACRSVYDILHQTMDGFNKPRHLTELEPNCLVFEQFLAEGLASQGMSVAVFQSDTTQTQCSNSNPQALVGESCFSLVSTIQVVVS